MKLIEKNKKKKKKKLTPIKRRKSKLKDSGKLDNSVNSINFNESFTSFINENSTNTTAYPNNIKINSKLKSTDYFSTLKNNNDNFLTERRNFDMINNYEESVKSGNINEIQDKLNKNTGRTISVSGNHNHAGKLRGISTSKNKILESPKKDQSLENTGNVFSGKNKNKNNKINYRNNEIKF